MGRKRKLPTTELLASAVNYWLACGRTRHEIAAEWGVPWNTVSTALRRGGYCIVERRYVYWRKDGKN